MLANGLCRFLSLHLNKKVSLNNLFIQVQWALRTAYEFSISIPINIERAHFILTESGQSAKSDLSVNVVTLQGHHPLPVCS